MTSDEPAASIPAEAAADVGSHRLAMALAQQDVAAIGQALRHDYVVVPVTRGPGGDVQTAVFGTPGSSELCLFSSAATFAAYDAPAEEFALQRGTSLTPFLEEHRSRIGRVLFDPAGPHPAQASVEDVLGILQPQVTDDDVAWAAGAAVTEPVPTERTVALDLSLPEGWAVVGLDVPRLDTRVAELLERQLPEPATRAALRSDLTGWLVASAHAAADGGGRFMAVLTRRTGEDVLAVDVALHWHELGPQIGGRTHLAALAERLRSARPEGEEVREVRAPAGVRHTRVEPGARAPGGPDRPVLVVDHWLLFPDRRGLALLRFTSPDPGAREPVEALAEPIAGRASWVTAPPGGRPLPG